MVVSSKESVKPRANMTKSNKIDKSLLIVAQELKLARILAGNNKTLRDRTLKKLKKWFDARETQMPFTEDDFMRIWKGLFYYMWMSDKLLIQEECAENISKLANFNVTDTSLLFYKCFLKTMIHEWFGIDNLRLDKFLMLVRRVTRQVLRVLDNAEWNLEDVKVFTNVINETVLNLDHSVPLSLSMHIAEIYLEELAKVSKGNVSEEIVLELTRPFAQQVAFTKDGRLNQHIKQYVFRYLINQSDVGIEYQLKFDAWRQLGFRGGSIDAMEKVDLDNNEEQEAGEDMPELDDNNPLDPRAGKVHVDLPQLKFDSLKMVEMLEELKLDTRTTTKTRRQLNNLAQQFKVLADGKYPFGLNKLQLKPNNDGYSTNIKSSLKRLQRFEQNLYNDNNKKKKKNKKIKEIIQKELEKYQNVDDTPATESTEENETLEDFISKSEEGLFEKPLKNNKKVVVPEVTKKSKKRKLSEETTSSKKRIARNSGVWEIDELDLDTSSVSTDETFTDVWTSEKSDNEVPSVSPKKIKKKTKAKSASKEKQASPKKPKLELNGDVFSTPKSMKLRDMSTPKSLLKNPFSTPVSSAKKVKIALNLNRSQDHSEYHQSLVSSPGIPFDADRKPSKPLLKTRMSLPSAINPFYKLK